MPKTAGYHRFRVVRVAVEEMTRATRYFPR